MSTSTVSRTPQAQLVGVCKYHLTGQSEISLSPSSWHRDYSEALYSDILSGIVGEKAACKLQ